LKDDIVLIPRHQFGAARPHYQGLKRILDLSLSLAILPIAMPIALLCAIAIRLDSPGPILFVQRRVGKGGRIFTIFKFRTMVHNHESEAERSFMRALVQGKIDDKVDGTGTFKPAERTNRTRAGYMLRKLSLDELPQLINVIIGNMSLVGPRPNVIWEVEAYQSWHHVRLEVLPGITGLAQVKGRSAITFDQIVNYDVEYIENRSLPLDLKIIFWTVLAVMGGKGAE
jgi:lipopolysaccharide/colanic/teichoic acid biosynthesis glycosyltransferase